MVCRKSNRNISFNQFYIFGYFNSPYLSFGLSFLLLSCMLIIISFNYLANVLQHSSLNGWFHEDSENKTANVFSLIFVSFYCSYVDISVNAL